MMKISSLIALLLCLLIACQSEDTGAEMEQAVPRATLQMSVRLASLSDGLSARSATAVPPLWVVVFDGAGYLVEYARAEHLRPADGVVHFDVTLRTTSHKRIVHFLFNYGEKLSLPFGHESAVVGGLTVGGGRSVAWQRVVMEQGLSSATVEEALQHVALVRNVARIRVKNEDMRHFSLTGFYVLNVADRGSVAPYAGGRFVAYLTPDGSRGKDYQALTADEHYHGAVPSDAVLMHRPGGADEGLTWTPDGAAWELYEHTHTDDASTTLAVMLKGRYRGGAETYYKVDLVRQEAERAVYYHILRNFEYEVRIHRVVGDGEPSFVEACRGLSGNNLSSATLVRKVLNVSDGRASLRVAYTDTTLVGSTPVSLRYRYVPDLSRLERTRNSAVAAAWLEGDDGALFDAEIADDGAEGGWATLTLRPKAVPPYPRTQSLLVYSEENQLSREVVFELRPAYRLEAVCSPARLTGKLGETVRVDLLLPEGLKPSLFPLSFLIEAQKAGGSSVLENTLSPRNDEVISVTTGTSLVEGFEDRKSIQYVKTLDYAAYESLPRTADGARCRLTCYFVTNTADAAAWVYVGNKYFEKARSRFGF